LLVLLFILLTSIFLVLLLFGFFYLLERDALHSPGPAIEEAAIRVVVAEHFDVFRHFSMRSARASNGSTACVRDPLTCCYLGIQRYRREMLFR